MIQKKIFGATAFTFIMFAAIACKSNTHFSDNATDSTQVSKPSSNNTPTEIGSFTATVAGKSYVGKLNHATQTLNYANSGNNVFTIESFASSDASTAATTEHFVMLIHFTGDKLTTGTYNFEVGDLSKPFATNKGTYSDGASRYNFDPKRGGSGSIIITEIDEAKGLVSGTFSGTAISGSDKITVTDGKFSNLTVISGN